MQTERPRRLFNVLLLLLDESATQVLHCKLRSGPVKRTFPMRLCWSQTQKIERKEHLCLSPLLSFSTSSFLSCVQLTTLLFPKITFLLSSLPPPLPLFFPSLGLLSHVSLTSVGGREHCGLRCFHCSKTSWRKETQTSETKGPPSIALLQHDDGCLMSPSHFSELVSFQREGDWVQHTNARREALIHKCNTTHMFKHTHRTQAAAPTQTSHTNSHTHWRYNSEGSSWNQGLGAGGKLTTIWISACLPRSSASSINQQPTVVQSFGFWFEVLCQKRVRKWTNIRAAREGDTLYMRHLTIQKLSPLFEDVRPPEKKSIPALHLRPEAMVSSRLSVWSSSHPMMLWSSFWRAVTCNNRRRLSVGWWLHLCCTGGWRGREECLGEKRCCLCPVKHF